MPVMHASEAEDAPGLQLLADHEVAPRRHVPISHVLLLGLPVKILLIRYSILVLNLGRRQNPARDVLALVLDGDAECFGVTILSDRPQSVQNLLYPVPGPYSGVPEQCLLSVMRSIRNMAYIVQQPAQLYIHR